MSNKKKTTDLVTHPDNLVPKRKYSVLVEYRGRIKRVSGMFLAMQLAYDGMSEVKPEKPILVIVLRRSQDTIFVPWTASKSWTLIN